MRGHFWPHRLMMRGGGLSRDFGSTVYCMSHGGFEFVTIFLHCSMKLNEAGFVVQG